MKKILLVSFFMIAPLVCLLSQIINKKPLSPRQTYYSIDAVLDTYSKSVSGTMESFWVNMSTDVVSDV